MNRIIDNINKKTIKIDISENKFNKIKQDLKSEIKDNKKIFNQVKDIDSRAYMKQVNLNRFIEFIDSYNFNTIDNNLEYKAIVYNGNPYITLHICMQALRDKTPVILLYDDFMLGNNEVLISLVKSVLDEYKLGELIFSKETNYIQNINAISKYVSKVVVIGNTGIYNNLKIHNKTFYPSNNLMLYCDDDKYEDVKRATFEYCMETKDELEILYENNIEDAINLINMEKFSNSALLLSSNDENQKFFKEKIINKEIFINENPFKNELIKVYDYLV